MSTRRRARPDPTLLTHRLARWLDDRLGAAKFARTALNKVFPDHWSFMLGELAPLLLRRAGADRRLPHVLLRPEHRARSSTTAATSRCGACEMTEAYRSALELSFDVRAGLVMRQIHHWAALLFLASIVVHLARVFFTGAFRRPREINWIIGVTLLILAMLQRASRLLAARRPAVGHRAAHRLLDRAVDPAGRHVAGVAAVRRRVPRARHHRAALRHPHPARAGGDRGPARRAHLGILVRHKHTQFPGPGRREDNVVGERLWPTYAAKALGLFFLTVGGAGVPRRRGPDQPDLDLRPVRPGRGVARPASPTGTWAGSTARCGSCPAWEIRAFGFEIPNPFFPGVLLAGLTFAPAVRLAVPRGPGHRRPRRAPPARPAAPAPGAHRARRGDARVLHGAASSAGRPTCWPRRSACR